MSNRKLGSIALARELCVQIAGYTDDDQDQCGHDYGSVDIAEILSAEVVRLQAALAQPEQEPTPWRDMVVVSLVREGINKHRARELADHFAAPPQQQPVFDCPRCGHCCPEAEPVAWAVQACSKMWRGEFAEIDAKAEAKRIGGTCVAYALYTLPPQREWQSLTDEDWEKVVNRKNTVLDTFEQGATWAAYKLERRNK